MSKLKHRLAGLNKYSCKTKNMKKYANLFKLKKLASEVKLEVTDEWLLDEFGDGYDLEKYETDEEKIDYLRDIGICVFKNPSRNEWDNEIAFQMLSPMGSDSDCYYYMDNSDIYVVNVYLNDIAVAQLGLDSLVKLTVSAYNISMEAKGKTGEEIIEMIEKHQNSIGDTDYFEVNVSGTSDNSDGTYELENGKLIKL